MFPKASELSGKELQNIKLAIPLVVVLVAALMLFFSGSATEEKTTAAEPAENEKVERRLEEILSGVKGAGNVRVMIVFKDDGRESIAMNTEYSEDSDGSIKTQSTAVLGENKNVIVVSRSIPEVQGVIVTAQGAENPQVREDIKKAVLAVLPVHSHRIEVLVGE